MFRTLAFVGSTLLLLGAANTPPSLLRSDAPALQITTSIAPTALDHYQLLRRPVPGMYRCSVTVHDEPGSNRIWATKTILLGPGETGEDTSTVGPMRVHFRVAIGKTLDRATTTVTIYRDDKAINRQVSTVWLQRPTGSLDERR